MSKIHFDKVNDEKIIASFTSDKKHRIYLEIPFINREGNNTLCIIGQNPSDADEKIADDTAYYLERFVFEKLPQYSKIILLNLYSRIDKSKNYSDDLIRDECELKFEEIIKENSDFLIIYGVLENQDSYKFLDRAKILKTKLADKSVYKIDLGNDYAPHPGNPNILYRNYKYNLAKYNFEDIK
jgi:hypothetical protein